MRTAHGSGRFHCVSARPGTSMRTTQQHDSPCVIIVDPARPHGNAVASLASQGDVAAVQKKVCERHVQPVPRCAAAARSKREPVPKSARAYGGAASNCRRGRTSHAAKLVAAVREMRRSETPRPALTQERGCGG